VAVYRPELAARLVGAALDTVTADRPNIPDQVGAITLLDVAGAILCTHSIPTTGDAFEVPTLAPRAHRQGFDRICAGASQP
jgi:hypothetical protein